ncbi:MAG: hypothetical protein J6Y72_04805 [Bacteroidales bacterium]|nr:hypothetical protein [Bacteroidales bacterium]
MANNKKIFRVALASTDGYTIDVHYGRATDFYIYQYLTDEWIFVEKRQLAAVCLGGAHESDAMMLRAHQLNDCQYVVASRIGVGAQASLRQEGIIPIALPGDIMEMLDKIYTYEEIQNIFNQ